jgi:hypothetical protein
VVVPGAADQAVVVLGAADQAVVVLGAVDQAAALVPAAMAPAAGRSFRGGIRKRVRAELPTPMTALWWFLAVWP